MKQTKLTLKAGAGSTRITREDALRFFGQAAVIAGERSFETEDRGAWSICTKITGLAVTATWKPGPGYNVVDTYTLHGDRTASWPKESGYHLEGRVSIDGAKRSCFTSSILFELTEGKLINVAVLHCRTKEDTKP